MKTYQLLFFLFTNFIGFAQKKTNLTIEFEKNIPLNSISYSIDNGQYKINSIEKLKSRVVNLTEPYYSEFATVLIQYSDSSGLFINHRFFVNNHKASIYFFHNTKETALSSEQFKSHYAYPTYDTLKNMRLKGLMTFTKKESQAFGEFWAKNSNPDSWNDSINDLSKQLLKTKIEKTIDYLKEYPNEYFSFWYFKDQLINASLYFLPKDTSYLKHLLATFTHIFPQKSSTKLERSAAINMLQAAINPPSANQTAIPIKLKDTSGKFLTLGEFKGKYVLLDFWASWCKPCRENNAALKEIYAKYDKARIEIISISADSKLQDWKKAIIVEEMTWKNVSDLKGYGGSAFTQYAIDAVPTYILVDPDGRIVFRYVNEIENVKQALENIFKK